ncbi:MAG: Ig-like domain-containing protein [Gemmatimonadota bacterium]|nr:Ig-like domain-containing protein [Gemmatimonadota bacterium]
MRRRTDPRGMRSHQAVAACALIVSLAACSEATAPVIPTPTTVVPAVDSVAFTALGQIQVVTATVLDQFGVGMVGAASTWTSSSATVVTVTAAGVATAVGNGAATLTVTSGGASAQVVASVAQTAGSVLLSLDSVVLKDPGDTTRLGVTALDSRGSAIASPTVIWTSADGAIATVDSAGLVTAVGTGTAVISAQVDGAFAQTTARVEPEVTVVAAGPTVLSGEVASELSLSVKVEDLLGAGYVGAAVSWSVGAGSGAITSGATTSSGASGHSGAVWMLDTIAGPQQAMASIESRGNVVQVVFSATAVAGAAVSATLAADSILLNGRGETAFLGPTYADRYGNPTSFSGAVWLSRDPAVATSSPTGLITAVDPGATYVVASIGSPSDSVLVTVSLRGAITVTFDDGFREVAPKALPVFQALGLRGNIAVNPAQVGFPAYIAKDSLDVLDAAGWSMVSHTMTHDTMTTLTVGELDYELRASKEWIDAQGYEGSNVFIVPFLTWGARERDAVGSYYEAARGASATAVAPDTTLVPWRPAQPFELTGIEADELPYWTLAGRDALRDILQRTADEGAFVDVFFHHLEDMYDAEFQLVMDVIDEFHDRVLPYHELYPRFARSVF